MKGAQGRTAWRSLAAQIPPEQLRTALHAAVDALVDALVEERAAAPREGAPPRASRLGRRARAASADGAQDPPEDPEIVALEETLRRKGVIL